MPRKFYHRVMYIAPSSGHISFHLNMPFHLILRRCEVVLWCLEWECCTFWKLDWNSLKSTNKYTIEVWCHISIAPYILLVLVHMLRVYVRALGWVVIRHMTGYAPVSTQTKNAKRVCFQTYYRKASSRGAYGHDPFWSFLKSIDLIPQQQILQRHYLYYR